MKRFAFLTPEFPTNSATAGGLATFLGRITRALVDSGCQVDVFLPAKSEARGEWFGVRIFNVPVSTIALNSWNKGPGSWWGRLNTSVFTETLHNAKALAAALEVQQEITPYDVVHGADFGLTTFYVKRSAKWRVVVRSSAPHSQYRQWWGTSNRLEHFLMTRAEHALFRRSDIAYSPSVATARFYRAHAGVGMKVIRPPIDIDSLSSSRCDIPLPDRFLLHFGNINRAKGSDWLSNALINAWETHPELTMVWAGTDSGDLVHDFRKRWGGQSKRVQWLGALGRDQMMSVVRKAVAVVAPSRVDNLPNSVLEAQGMHVPVIGSAESSIDEIVVDSITGSLVSIDDVNGLAKELVKAWNGNPPFHSKCPIPPIFDEMVSTVAVNKLLNCISASMTYENE